METFADRLKAAMNEQGLKQVDLVRLAQQKGIKLGKSHVSQYVSGKTIPRTDILQNRNKIITTIIIITIMMMIIIIPITIIMIMIPHCQMLIRYRHPQIIQEV